MKKNFEKTNEPHGIERKFSIKVLFYYYFKLLGLCPFVLIDNEISRVSVNGIVYTCMLCIISTNFYCRMAYGRLVFAVPGETPTAVIADFIGLWFEFLCVMSVWLWLAYSYNQLREIINLLQGNKYILKEFGITDDLNKIYDLFKNYIIIANFASYCFFIFDHIVLFIYAEFDLAVIMPFDFLRILGHNVIMFYSVSLSIVRKRYNSINKIINEYSETSNYR